MIKKCKMILALLLCFVAAGCAGEYNLKIDGDKLNEEIIAKIYESDHSERQYEEDKIDMADQFINSNFYAFFEDYDKQYNKVVKEKKDYTEVTLTYDYTLNNFQDSYYINTCFQNKKIKKNGNNYSILLSGYFYCLYGDEFDIKVKSNNKVLSNNADEKKGSLYIWHIDKNNYQNLNIKIKLENKSIADKISDYTIYIIIGFIVLISSAIGVLIRMKSKKNNNI